MPSLEVNVKAMFFFAFRSNGYRTKLKSDIAGHRFRFHFVLQVNYA